MKNLPVEKIIKVPEGLVDMQTVLELDGVTVIESCLFLKQRRGLMFLQDHLLLFVLEGTYAVRYGNQEHIVRKNEMVLLQKSIVVEYDKSGEPGNNDMLDYMQFFLKDELLKDFLKLTNVRANSIDAPVPVYVKPINERLLKYIGSLKPYFTDAEKIQEGLIRIKLLELLYDLATADEHIMRQLLYLRQPVRVNIQAVVEENLMNPVSLEDLAYLSGRSLSSFKRDFQAIYNLPPAQWIREKRLDKARELLANSTLSVTDICIITGFKNVAHFSRAFKDHFGYSPSSLKQNSSV